MVSHFQLPFMPEALVPHVVVHHLTQSGLKEPAALLAPLAQLLAVQDDRDSDAELPKHDILYQCLQQQKELTYHRTCTVVYQHA